MGFVPCNNHKYFINNCQTCVAGWLSYCSFCDRRGGSCVCGQESPCPCGDHNCYGLCIPQLDYEWADVMSAPDRSTETQEQPRVPRKRDLINLTRDSVRPPSGTKADRRLKARRSK